MYCLFVFTQKKTVLEPTRTNREQHSIECCVFPILSPAYREMLLRDDLSASAGNWSVSSLCSSNDATDYC